MNNVQGCVVSSQTHRAAVEDPGLRKRGSLPSCQIQCGYAYPRVVRLR